MSYNSVFLCSSTYVAHNLVVGALKFSVSTRPDVGHVGKMIVWTISECALESSVETGVNRSKQWDLRASVSMAPRAMCLRGHDWQVSK